MARIARAVAPGVPHHVTQRGNRRQQTFFSVDDYRSYLELMSEWCAKYRAEIWVYCLMPNHVHLIAVPETKDSLNLAIGEAHRRYTRRINFHKGWRGHLWPGRFSSFIMEETYLLACARYVELNPVRANLVKKPEDWRWSSAKAHMKRKDDILVKTRPVLEIVNKPWKKFLASDVQEFEMELFRKHERTGRPLGEASFIEKMELLLDRRLKLRKPGPKKKISKVSPEPGAAGTRCPTGTRCRNPCGTPCPRNPPEPGGKCIEVCPTGKIAAGKKGFRVQLGGKLGRHPKLARELPGLFGEEEVLEIVSSCTAYTKKNSRNGERFADIVENFDFLTLPGLK